MFDCGGIQTGPIKHYEAIIDFPPIKMQQTERLDYNPWSSIWTESPSVTGCHQRRPFFARSRSNVGSGMEFYDFELRRSGRAHSWPPEAEDEKEGVEREERKRDQNPVRSPD